MDYHGKSNLLGSVLVAHGLITEAQLDSALTQQKTTRKRLGEILVSNGWISEIGLMKGISQQLFIPFISLPEIIPETAAIELIPSNVAERLDIFPIEILDESKLRIAISEPLNVLAIDEIHLITGLEVELAVATCSDIKAAIDRFYRLKNCAHASFESEKSFRLGEVLFTAGLISEKQLNMALEEQKTSGKKLGEIIVEHQWINELQLTDAMSRQLHIPMVLLASHEPSPPALKKVPRSFAEKYAVLPLSVLQGNVLQLAVSNLLSASAVEELRTLTQCNIEYVLALPSALRRELPRFYRVIEMEGLISERITQKGALLGDLLMNDGVLTRSQLNDGLEEQRVNRMRLGDIFIKNGVITEKQLARAISAQLGLPMISLGHYRPSPEALNLVPQILAQRLEVIPLSIEGNSILRIAIAEPLNLLAIDELRTFTGLNIELMVTTPTDIRSKMADFYSGAGPVNSLFV